jgi:hypothetical protein
MTDIKKDRQRIELGKIDTQADKQTDKETDKETDKQTKVRTDSGLKPILPGGLSMKMLDFKVVGIARAIGATKTRTTRR